jgi:hypothetical protein
MHPFARGNIATAMRELDTGMDRLSAALRSGAEVRDIHAAIGYMHIAEACLKTALELDSMSEAEGTRR